jgi:adenylosuccinate lyase
LKEDSFGYDTFLSPFTWRYGSARMREIFSEKERRAAWRRVWAELARAEASMGLISRGELDDIVRWSDRKNVDIERAHKIEEEIKHDLMAELRVFAGQAKVGGGKLHLGATSMDIEDNADVMLFGEALDLVLSRLVECLRAARAKAVQYKATVCMAWTHLQPAEPTTLGYRLSNYAQDLVSDIAFLEMVRDLFLRGKGIKGAVGTSASFKRLLGNDEKVKELEGRVMKRLGIEPYPVSTQTYPRKLDFFLLACLSSIAQSCHKFGLDLRVMQSPAFGELSEPIEEYQVGSSAMPFKRNPTSSERMCSLSRLVFAYPAVALANAGSTILERTLDDSAARRVMIPEAFLAVDESLMIYKKLMTGLRVYPAMIEKNLQRFGPFAGTEAIMMKLVMKGADRQDMHELMRVQSSIAWERVMKGGPNPLVELLSGNSAISGRLSRKELKELLDPRRHTGDAEARCERFVKLTIDPVLAKHGKRTTVGKARY